MILVSSFVQVLQEVSFVMTAPSFGTFLTLTTGWVFARRRTVTGMLLAANASADTKAVAYCDALVQKYERHINIGSAKSRPPQGLETRHAVEQCKAGDIRGISGLEKALENAKIPLPSRG